MRRGVGAPTEAQLNHFTWRSRAVIDRPSLSLYAGLCQKVRDVQRGEGEEEKERRMKRKGGGRRREEEKEEGDVV